MTATSGADEACPRLAEPTASIGQFYRTDVAGAAMFGAAFDPVVADPNVTYTLAKFTFDLSTVNCACPDQEQCLNLEAMWLDANSEQHYFFYDRQFLTWNDPYATSCGGPPLCGNPADCIDPPNPCALGPTPVQAQTWGRVKASYR